MPHTPEDNKEKLILLAAMSEFNERGIYGARMKNIADRAGVNKALLHYYFRSKEKLYLTILEKISGSFWEQFVDKISTLDPSDFEGFVRVLATIVVDSARAESGSKILLMEFASGGLFLNKMESRFHNSLQQNMGKTLSFLQQLMDDGIIKPMHPMMVFCNIIGMCWNIFLSEPFAASFFEMTGIERGDNFYESYISSIVEMAVFGMTKKTPP